LDREVDVAEEHNITSQDIRHQEFSSRLRGYDKDEVEEFLTAVAGFVEKLAAEKAQLTQKIELLEKQLAEFKEMESTLKNTLLRSQESADDVKRSAQKESELIIREAQIKADRLIEERREKIRKLESNYEALQSKWDEYFIKFKNLLTSHLDTLENMENEYKRLAQDSVKQLPEI
jgi:cell division initiation protein